MRKNNSVYVFLIIFFIVFFFLVYFLIGVPNSNKERMNATIILGNDCIWEFNNNRLKKSRKEKEEFNWKKFDIYLDGKYSGKNYVWNDEKWNIFNNSKETITYNEKLIGIDSNYSINNQEINKEYITDFTRVNDYLKQNKIKANQEYTQYLQTEIDIDSDGKKEILYTISNALAFDFEPEKVFSFVFMEKDGKFYEIYNYVSDENYTSKIPELYSVLDIDNDGIYEIIVEYDGYVTIEPSFELYKFNNETFTKVISE